MKQGESRVARAALGAVGLVGLICFVLLSPVAFPDTRVEMGLDREQARRAAESFLDARGIDLSDYDSSTILGVDQPAVTFLQRTQEPDNVRQALRGEVTGWQWLTRWYRPHHAEEFQVAIDAANGHVVGYQHILPENGPGADLSQAEAVEVGRQFLQSLGLDPALYDLAAYSNTRLAARTDHELTWQRRDLDLGAAALPVKAVVRGARVESFSQELIVPESFARDLAGQQSAGQLLSLAGLLLVIVLVLSSLLLAVRLLRAHVLPWRFGLPFGVALAASVVLGAVNKLPLRQFDYPTRIDQTVYLVISVAGSLLVGLLLGSTSLLAAAVGRAQEDDPDGPSSAGPGGARYGGLAERLGRAWMPGYALAFAYLGFRSAFYLVGHRALGVWTAAGTAATDLFSALVPLAVPLITAVQATVTEEIGFRMFCIPVLKRRLRSVPLVILLAAVGWSLVHTSQAIYPISLRLLELAVVGCAFGFVFVRFGLTAVILAHLVADVTLLSLPLFSSTQPWHVAGGVLAVLVVVAPLVVGVGGLFRSRSQRRHVERMTEEARL